MNERNPPADAGIADDGALTLEQGVEQLTELFTPPAKEPAKKEPSKAESDTEEDATAQDAATQAEDGDEKADAQSDDAKQDEENDESETKEPAIIEDDDALVAMEDGTRLTLRELKRNAVRDSVFTQKTQEIASHKREVDEQSQRVLEHAATVRQQRDLLIQYMQQHMPQPPSEEELQADPVGYLAKKATYDKAVSAWQQMHQAKMAEEQQQTMEMRAQAARKQAEETEALIRHHPELKNPAKQAEVRTKISNALRYYNFPEQQWQEFITGPAADHRLVRVMMDAAEYRALKAAGPTVQKQVAQKPKMLKPGKAAPIGTGKKEQADSALNRLKKTGSLKDGVDALLQFENL